MDRIIDWKAKRAGGRITITGKDAETGAAVKIVGVDLVEAGGVGKPPIATDLNAEQYILG